MNDVEANQISRYASIIKRSAFVELKRQLDLEGLTAANVNLLLFIKDEKRITARTIASRLVLSKAAVSRELNRLLKKGYIQKEPDQEDRRNSWLTVTDKGEQVCRKINKLMAAWWRSKFKRAGIKRPQVMYHELDKLVTAILEKTV